MCPTAGLARLVGLAGGLASIEDGAGGIAPRSPPFGIRVTFPEFLWVCTIYAGRQVGTENWERR